jgi:hypothetical protein
LQLVKLSAGNVSFVSPEVDKSYRSRLEMLLVWTDIVDVWTGKVTFRTLDATTQAARRIF